MELNPEAPILIIGERASISADQGEVPGWARFSGIIWTDIRKRLPPELMEEHIYIISGYNGLTKSSHVVSSRVRKARTEANDSSVRFCQWRAPNTC